MVADKSSANFFLADETDEPQAATDKTDSTINKHLAYAVHCLKPSFAFILISESVKRR
jgi:hypothetical protein